LAYVRHFLMMLHDPFVPRCVDGSQLLMMSHVPLSIPFVPPCVVYSHLGHREVELLDL
jgi:hypothetical protein